MVVYMCCQGVEAVEVSRLSRLALSRIVEVGVEGSRLSRLVEVGVEAVEVLHHVRRHNSSGLAFEVALFGIKVH